MGRYDQPNSYIKNEMGPPSARAPGEPDHHEAKDSSSMLQHPQGNGPVGHAQAEDETDHDHDGEYTHGNPANYDASRQSYSYANGTAVSNPQGEHSHISPEMTGSPNHQAGSGRATPRTAAPPQPYYSQQQAGYSTPPRVQPPSSNLYNVMSSERGTATNGGGSVYAPPSDMNSSVQNGYAVQQPMTGTPGGKRGREDEEDPRPSSRGPGADPEGLKRRKTIHEGPGGSIIESFGAPLNRARSTITQRRR